MKRQMQIANSSLLGIFISSAILCIILSQTAPTPGRHRSLLPVTFDCTKKPEIPSNHIYGRRDIFGTYQASKIAKKNLVKTIPQLTLPPPPAPPLQMPADFVDPLDISINGVVLAGDENDSMCIVADETDKEQTYRVGDQIKDGSIIKIAHHSVVILRANGQQETYFLHGNNDIFGKQKSASTFIHSTEQNIFEVDPTGFSEAVSSLGQFVEDVGLIPVFREGQCVGMKVGLSNPESLSQSLGLEKNDILISVNDFSLANKKERVKAYNSATEAKYGSKVILALTRDGSPLSLMYKIELPTTPPSALRSFSDNSEPSNAENVAKPALGKDRFANNGQPKRTSKSREFKERHAKQYDDNIAAIRKRLLENMKSRPRRVRAR